MDAQLWPPPAKISGSFCSHHRNKSEGKETQGGVGGNKDLFSMKKSHFVVLAVSDLLGGREPKLSASGSIFFSLFFFLSFLVKGKI